MWRDNIFKISSPRLCLVVSGYSNRWHMTGQHFRRIPTGARVWSWVATATDGTTFSRFPHNACVWSWVATATGGTWRDNIFEESPPVWLRGCCRPPITLTFRIRQPFSHAARCPDARPAHCLVQRARYLAHFWPISPDFLWYTLSMYPLYIIYEVYNDASTSLMS